MAKARTWTCQRQSAGVRCRHRNPSRRQLCGACGKRKRARRKPAHMKALDTMTYEQAVERYGERCGICGTPPKPGKKLHRDHEHRGDGRIRGLLCFPCNSSLRHRMNVEWLECAITYLKRTEER